MLVEVKNATASLENSFTLSQNVKHELVISSNPQKYLFIVMVILRAFWVVLVIKNPPANAGDIRESGSMPGSGRFPWRRAWQPIPVFLPEESHRQRSPAGYDL